MNQINHNAKSEQHEDNNASSPLVATFFDEDSSTFSYVVTDPSSNNCAVVDSVLDFDYASGGISYQGADAIIAYIEKRGLKLEWLIETHVHADHLSAAPYIQEKLGGKIGISEKITIVQDTFGVIFNADTQFARWRCWHFIRFDSTHSRATGCNTHLSVPRLPAGWSRTRISNNGGRRAESQHSHRCKSQQGKLRCIARSA